jgi:hypothetical protein
MMRVDAIDLQAVPGLAVPGPLVGWQGCERDGDGLLR